MKKLPGSLSRHLVPVLDLAGPHWETLWRDLLDLARARRLGGILLRRGRADQWRRVADEIRAAGEPRPILMADLEQGAASQLAAYQWLPKAFTVGATGSPKWAGRMGECIARQARALGLDMVLAPVADLLRPRTSSVIGTRSFGATPGRVGAMVEAFILGCQGEGIMAVVKHFPGHGRSRGDSHHCLARIRVGRDEWMRTDAIPFQTAIGAGIAAVMVGHLYSDGLDPGSCRPASRSPAIMRGLLREELGFRGLVMTDSLEMKGAGGRDLEAAGAAVEAGADLVIGSDLGCADAPENGVFSDRETDSECRGVDPWSQSVAEAAVAWVGWESPTESRTALSLLIVPDGKGRSAWADPLRAALRARDVLDSEGISLVVACATSPVHAVHSAVEEQRVRHGEKLVVVACGALDVARSLGGLMPVCFIGDATAASQVSVARLLCGEIEPRGQPDFP